MVAATSPKSVINIQETVKNSSISFTKTPSTTRKADQRQYISAMLKQEKDYLCYDYLKRSKSAKKQTRQSNNMAITPTCRAKICRWIFDIIDTLHFQRETAIIAMSYLDRYCCTNSPRARRARCSQRPKYQLAAVTSLYTAIKLHEPIGMDVDTAALLTQGVNTAEEIIDCEREMLQALKWRMHGPSPIRFVNYILELLPVSSRCSSEELDKIRKRSCEQIEKSTEDYGCVVLRPSSLALAAVLNSLKHVPQDIVSIEERDDFVQVISDTFDMDIMDSKLIKIVRMRLLGIM